MIPSVCRIMMMLVDPAKNNGSDVAPAIITRVWSDHLVNLRVLYDGHGTVEWMTSVGLFDTEDEARECENTYSGGLTCAAFWPPRV